MRISHRLGWLALAVLAGMSLPLFADAPTPALAPWADARLKTTAGLVLWLDASRFTEARRALALPPVPEGGPVEIWPDASGRKRNLVQDAAPARPTFQVTNGMSALRFNGRESHLRLTQIGLSWNELTLFVVAAPFANPGEFSAWLGFSQTGRNDYQTGLNLDQGFGFSQRLQTVNVESPGSMGERNLLRDASAFGVVQRLCVTSTPGKDGVKLFLNGKAQGARDRTGMTPLRMDEFVLGARYYTNGGPPQVRGFFEGDIAEVLIFDRVLSEADRSAVEKYLADKYGAIAPLPPPTSGGEPLVRLADPPPMQVFVPGFTVRRLPVDLSNINNVLYRRDGKLVALAYDGNIFLLSDSNADGLEDKAELFWENKGRLRGPIGMALTPPNYRHGEGVFVASKGKCSLIVDTDGDSKADKEIIIAEGWTELPHGVDALGVAVDPADHSVYFGLGSKDFTNPYEVDATGKAGYSLASERGTILRVAPDFRSRQIVATGVRFSVGLRFNREGDLFCTDQEGATWLPNGNPLDELLHIRKGRHYGFPPRHPKHLPGVVDEPSLFDYRPQHQSTCGLNFNESVHGGPVFGPSWWQADAFVAGYSRGKLYRTKLVKSAAGYVAQNQIVACLNQLAADVCVSPAGDLVVAAHSGGPDWGSGPSGKGTLFKVAYTGRETPQPVLAWAHSPREVRIAFDRPLSPQHLTGIKAGIAFGAHVSAGDRFESLWPGYKVVQDQFRAARHTLPVHSVQVAADQRTLLLTTAPHPEAVNYALTLSGLGRPKDHENHALRQIPETDVQYDLSGVQAAWRSKDSDGEWSGWLPHLDLEVARALTRNSADHDRLWSMMSRPGTLTLRTALQLRDLLRPAVQPGSRIDYHWPSEQPTVILRSRSPFTVAAAGGGVTPAKVKDGESILAAALRSDERVPMEIVLTTGEAAADLRVSWHTQEDPSPRAFPLTRFVLPWAPRERIKADVVAAADVPELAGGNWSRGRKLFLSEQALCSKCHSFQGEGASLGPDLSNLPHRDYHSVLRDVAEPNFAINPDYIAHVIHLKSGRVLTGTVRTESGKLLIADIQGQVVAIANDDIDEMHPARTSIMPEGLARSLGPEKMRDLLTYLLTDPPRMPDYGRGKAPPPRSRRDVDAILAGGASDAPASLRKLHIVLVAGRKDHGPGEHDYPAWQAAWRRLLGMAEATTLDTALDWPTPPQFRTADVLVFYQQGRWTPERARDMDAFLARGGGAVYIHYAVDGGQDAPGFAQRIGLAWQANRSRFRHGPLDLGFDAGRKHPISRNLDRLQLYDESYWQLVGDPKRIELLATGREEGADQPLFWTLEPAKGRVFVSIPGHFSWSFDDPMFRILLLRGIAWCARESVDRFNELVWPAARVR